jgi:hypothetical protein
MSRKSRMMSDMIFQARLDARKAEYAKVVAEQTDEWLRKAIVKINAMITASENKTASGTVQMLVLMEAAKNAAELFDQKLMRDAVRFEIQKRGL